MYFLIRSPLLKRDPGMYGLYVSQLLYPCHYIRGVAKYVFYILRHGVCGGCKRSEACNIAEIASVETSDIHRMRGPADYLLHAGRYRLRKPYRTRKVVR